MVELTNNYHNTTSIISMLNTTDLKNKWNFKVDYNIEQNKKAS